MVDGDVPERMQAAAFDEFGGPEVITLRKLPIPQVADDEVLIKVLSAGVGVWDAYERRGCAGAGGLGAPDRARLRRRRNRHRRRQQGDQPGGGRPGLRLRHHPAEGRPLRRVRVGQGGVRGEGARWCARRARRCHAHRRADRAGRARHRQPVGRRLAADLRRERRSGPPGRAVGEAAGAERDRRGVRSGRRRAGDPARCRRVPRRPRRHDRRCWPGSGTRRRAG